jgi:hypothetical protein
MLKYYLDELRLQRVNEMSANLFGLLSYDTKLFNLA